MKLSDKILYIICFVSIILCVYTIYRTDTAITSSIESCNTYWLQYYNLTNPITTDYINLEVFKYEDKSNSADP